MSPGSQAILFVLVCIFQLSTSNFHCVTRKSNPSATADKAQVTVGCITNEILVSCGCATIDANDANIHGSFVSNDPNSNSKLCVAINGMNGNGVKAYARCCTFVPNDISCIGFYDNGAAGFGGTYSSHCSRINKQFLTGCSSRNDVDNAAINGAYPGYSAPDWYTGSDIDDEACTSTGEGSKPTLVCCDSPTYNLNCVQTQGPASLSTVSYQSITICDAGYTMTGCSAHGYSNNINAWYISDNNQCIGRSTSLSSIWTTAICCKLQTDSPTTDPTTTPTTLTQYPSTIPTYQPTTTTSNTPTKYPTEITTSPTKYPSTIPTYQPTTTPSDTPIKYPSFHPSFNPTEVTISPTKYPTLSPTKYPTLSPTVRPINENEVPDLSTTNSVEHFNNNINDKKQSDNEIETILILSFIIAMVIIIFILITVYYKKKKHMNNIVENIHKDQNQFTIETVSPASANTSGGETEVTTPRHDTKSEVNTHINGNNLIELQHMFKITAGVGVIENNNDKGPTFTEGHTRGNSESAVRLEINTGENLDDNMNETIMDNDHITATDDGHGKNEQNEDVLLDGMLSDIMKMDDLDPNKIHENNMKDLVHKQNNDSNSDDSNNMYET